MLNFAENIKHRAGPAQILEEIMDDVTADHNLSDKHNHNHSEQSNGAEDVDEGEEMQHHSVQNKAQRKDVDFSSWKTDLAMLQHYCACIAGAQMLNPCSRIRSCIYLIIWTKTSTTH